MTFDEEHALETFKSLITVSMEGLKVLLLINGGAVVALLAFLGQSALGPKLAPQFWWPMGYFVAGVGFCTLAFVASYFTQFSLYNEHFPERNYRGPKHTSCLWVAALFVFASVGSFGFGAFASVNVFASITPEQIQKCTSPLPALTNAPNQKSHTDTRSAGPNPPVKQDANLPPK